MPSTDNSLFVNIAKPVARFASNALGAVQNFNTNVLGASGGAPKLTVDLNGQKRFNPGAFGNLTGKVGAIGKVADVAPSVMSYIAKNGQKVFTKLSNNEYKNLFNEVGAIPQQAKGVSQIHLDPYNSRLHEVAQELPRDQFIQGHPQAAQSFSNANPIKVKAHQRGDSIVQGYQRRFKTK